MGRRAAARVSADGAQSGAPSWPRVDSALAGRVVWFMGLHVPLGVLMHQVPSLATVHAVLTVTVAVLLAMFGRLYRVVYAAAYIAGSEVLWRMCGAEVFWESGKYAVLLIFSISIVRFPPVRWRTLPALYFLFLLPSIAVVPYALLAAEARR